MRLFLVLALVALLAGSPAVASDSAAEAASDALLREIEHTGRMIFQHDRAAAIAERKLRDDRRFKRDRRVRGWLTEATENDETRGLFVGGKANQPLELLYQVTVKQDGSIPSAPRRFNQGTLASAQQDAAFAARTRALAGVDTSCAKTYRAVVMPRNDSGWAVYLLPKPRNSSTYPIGGSFRVEYAADGETELSSRGYAKTCVDLSDGVNMVSFMISHLLDPQPTPIHVYANLLAGKAIYVVTTDNGVLWSVKEGSIEFMSTIEKESSKAEADPETGGADQ